MKSESLTTLSELWRDLPTQKSNTVLYVPDRDERLVILQMQNISMRYFNIDKLPAVAGFATFTLTTISRSICRRYNIHSLVKQDEARTEK